mmetsp:Transcript_78920/g.223340  ORF Transcript_78920/g.223340 Transcript_78920/m.223340 type:complete len:224 (-) Transcript_78920:276-947(-)
MSAAAPAPAPATSSRLDARNLLRLPGGLRTELLQLGQPALRLVVAALGIRRLCLRLRPAGALRCLDARGAAPLLGRLREHLPGERRRGKHPLAPRAEARVPGDHLELHRDRQLGALQERLRGLGAGGVAGRAGDAGDPPARPDPGPRRGLALGRLRHEVAHALGLRRRHAEGALRQGHRDSLGRVELGVLRALVPLLPPGAGLQALLLLPLLHAGLADAGQVC